MAQTVGAIHFNNCKVVYGTTSGFGTTTDLSGIASAITIGGGDVTVAKAWTFGTKAPILVAGTHEALEVTLKTVYSEVTADSYVTLMTVYLANTGVFLKFAPKGGTTGDFCYTTSTAFITGVPIPQGEVNAGDVVMNEWKLACSTITQSTLAAPI